MKPYMMFASTVLTVVLWAQTTSYPQPTRPPYGGNKGEWRRVLQISEYSTNNTPELWREDLGLDKAEPGALGTNLLTQATAAGVRGLIGLNPADPGSMGTNWLTLSTAGDGRSALGLGEWGTNLYFGLSTTNTSVRFATAADDTTIVGVRFAGNTNVSLLSMSTVGNGLLLTEADGTTPFVPDDISPSGVMNYSTLTNLFVLSTNSYGVLPLLDDDPAEIATADHGRIYSKIGQKSRATLFGQTLSGSTNLAAEVVMVGPDAVATVDTIILGSTNIIEGIAGKQPADAQLDEWASVSTNSVTALGVGALTGTTVIAPNITAVVADIAALEAHDSATTTTIVVKDVNRGGTFVATTIDAETYIPTMASLAITDGGEGYPAAPFWRTVSGGTGTAATVYVTEVTAGAITAARIANPGIYTAYPGTRTGAGTYTVTLTDGGVETSVATLTLTTASGVAVESTTDGTVWVRQYVGPIEDRWFAGTASTALRSALFTAAGGVGELLVGLRGTDYDLGELGPVDGNNVLQLGYASLNGLVIEGRGARLYSSDNLNACGMINLSDRSSGSASGVVTAGVTFRDMTIDSIQKTVGDPDGRIGVEWFGDTDGLLDPHLIAFESVTFTNCVLHHIYASGGAREVIFDGCTIYGEADGGHDEPNEPLLISCKDSNVTIRGCTFLNDAENNMVYASNYKTISVTDNVVENVSNFVDFRRGNFLVAGNRITGTGGVTSLAGNMIMAQCADDLIVYTNAVITDNVFVNCDSKNIIYLDQIKNVVVRDNIVKYTSATAYDSQRFVRCHDDVSDLYIDGNMYEGSPNAVSGNHFLYCYGTRTPLLRGVIGSNVMRNKMVFVNLENTIQSKPFIYVTGQNFLDDTYGTTHLPIKAGSYYTSHPYIVFGPGGGLTWTDSIGGTTYITGWAATLTTPSASIIRGAVGSTISDWQGRQWWSVSAVSNVVTTGGTNWVLRDLTTHTFHKMDYAETPTLLTDQASFFIADDPGSVTRMHVIDENSKTGPVDFGWRSPVTVQRTSLAGATKIVDESGDAIGNFDTGWTVGASWTTNSSAVVNATGATNSLSHTTVTALVGPPRYVTMTLVSGGAWTVDATASLTVTVGGSLMRTFTNADPPSGTMTISGMVDGTTDEVVFTVSAPDATTVSGSFDNFKIEVLAAGDFLHRHAYEAGALVKASSATAPAPYFEFSAAGTHAANGNAKDKVIALVNTTVTSAPAILATIPTTDNNGSWRLKGKVYAAYGGGASDYDNFMLELDYVDGSGTYTTSLHSTDLTGDVFAWNAAGYFLIGANADTADGDVTINTSSVEYKP